MVWHIDIYVIEVQELKFAIILCVLLKKTLFLWNKLLYFYYIITYKIKLIV